MIHHKVAARSQEWFQLRLGKPTASEFFRVLTPGGKISKQSEDYAHTLLAELMLGKPIDKPETEWMTRGTALEDSGIDAYEFERGVETSPGGFITEDLGPGGIIGCSPDRLVGEEGILEMKCPAPNTHVGYLYDPPSIQADKKPQIQGQLLVSDRAWVDLMSYHPELPPLIRRVVRDEPYIATLRIALASFCDVLMAMRASLEQRYGPFPQIVIGQPPTDDTLGVSDADIDQMISQGAIEL